MGNADENLPEFRDEKYTGMYASWALFLSSTRSTLQHFSYDHYIRHRCRCFLGSLGRTYIYNSADVLFNARTFFKS